MPEDERVQAKQQERHHRKESDVLNPGIFQHYGHFWGVAKRLLGNSDGDGAVEEAGVAAARCLHALPMAGMSVVGAEHHGHCTRTQQLKKHLN